MKEILEELKKAVIYQIFLRSFTKEGTLKAAEEMLESVRDLGVDIIYLCSLCEADDDGDERFLSKRQILSKTGNPKNPYRVKDYFKIDEEYGTDDDLRDFVRKAHALGMKVLLDLVYYHCGPKAVIMDMDKEFIKRDENGEPLCGEWKFPMLNYDSPKLREYMLENMEYFIREFDVDGYRTDVGDMVPMDFWEEGRRRIEAIKPDVIMLNEGELVRGLDYAFDFIYDFGWAQYLAAPFEGRETTHYVHRYWDDRREGEKNDRALKSYENHDIANDDGENRTEKRVEHGGVEAMTVLNFTMNGIPFIYNGNEVCDTNRHSLWSNRFYGGKEFINWRNALTSYGMRRRRIIKELVFLRKSTPELYDGTTRWLDNSEYDRVFSFLRGENILVVVNAAPESVTVKINTHCGTPLMKKDTFYLEENGKLKLSMLAHGYIIMRL